MHQDPIKILDAKAANGIGTPLYVATFRHIVLALGSTGTTTGTVRIQGSLSKTMPNFAAAQSPTNQWDYLRITDLEDMTGIDGDTGVAFAGADDNRQFEIETNGILWVNAIVSGYSAGAITLAAFPRTDND